ncbi:glycoside hydrolase family 13 protein [Babjeviella inositovora NRRL Y-12698]|uniref:Alpha-glucosidase n=1 Tax=Babjeviella inositovora NRRL Y-12698 TaxID=984486 RepID=A0A1E3QQR7_9ASCO|nr:glycoside hydrolase family 13 protein [Babjeviella inositovora NRRL Y-12698]ODQ79307.1 glycoside hydrolase family 13 protein [Babjeviella inositovora NRRL Y-12698]
MSDVTTALDQKWWKNATVYQIWPASYKDSNGDGVGDIPGIISTLDYVKDLGVDVVWLSPMFDSPQDDMGYDISNYEGIYPKYGTMTDMDNLIEETHKRGMKLILDLVINHTSNEHDWFKESRSSKTNPKRDWYIWRPPRIDENGNRQPPTNWKSHFSGSAWAYDELTDEYYLHLFAKSQPDLNWENPETREAIYKSAMKFWFDKGINGFRIDTAGLYSKTYPIRDVPIIVPDQEFQPAEVYTHNGPRIHEFHKEMFSKVTSNYDAMTVGEVGSGSREESLKYVSAKEKEMNMIFLFDVVLLGAQPTDRYRPKKFTLVDFKDAVKRQCEFVSGTDAWSTVFLENHDLPRSITRFGNASKKYHDKSGKLLAMMEAALTGTLFIYQGQEIGMTNFSRDWDISDYQDIDSKNYYKQIKEKNGNDKKKMQQVMDNLALRARDHARTPVQWDDSANAGFSTGKPWMRVNDNYKEINVKSQVNDPNSLLSFYKQVLKLRQAYKNLFIHGDFEILDHENKDMFTFTKTHEDKKALVVLNFSETNQTIQSIEGEMILSNVDQVNGSTLSPYEGRIYLLQ